MPSKQAIQRAKADKREGKSPSTQAGEFVHEEIEHVRQGKHGARSTRQAIAIGLSEARRAGVELPPQKGQARRKNAGRRRAASKTPRQTARKRSRATSRALKREGRAAASKTALSRHARKSASQRSSSERSAAARKAARTKGAQARSAAARKGARTRARNRGS